MTSRTRRLHNSIQKLAKRKIRLSGLKSRDMARWANLNLIDWLNKSHSVSAQRVIEIIGLAQSGFALAQELRQTVTDDQHRSCLTRIMEIVSKLNAVLFRYDCKAKIFWYGSTLSRQYLFLSRSARDPEITAVAFLIENLALAHRVRRCFECKRWFFAITEHQKYCRDRCRKSHAAQGEVFLEKRRTYMRDYRQRQKEADTRAKRLAKEK